MSNISYDPRAWSRYSTRRALDCARLAAEAAEAERGAMVAAAYSVAVTVIVAAIAVALVI